MAIVNDYCCRIIGVISCGILLLLVTAFVIGISVKSYNDRNKQYEDYRLSCDPRIYVRELYVPGLLNNNSNNNNNTQSGNSSIFISFEFKRDEASPGALATFSDLKMNLYYGEGPGFPVADSTVPHFRMGDRRSVSYTAVVEAPRLPWEDAFNKVSGGSSVLLRLELLGSFKAMDRPYAAGFYIRNCNSEWSELRDEAEVWVNASAHMLSNTPILFT